MKRFMMEIKLLTDFFSKEVNKTVLIVISHILIRYLVNLQGLNVMRKISELRYQ